MKYKIATTSKAIKQAGFTTLEMAIIVIITGLMIASSAQLYDQFMKRYRLEITKDRISEIKDAMNEYITLTGRIPCAARLDLPLSDPDFGKETDCTATAIPGTFDTTGRVDPVSGTASPVRIGAVPVKTLSEAFADPSLNPSGKNVLKISSEHAFDGWGNRLTYAVSAQMTTSAENYTKNNGGIQIIDTTGNDLTNPPQTALYVLVSHGPDSAGAYGREGTLVSACPAPTSMEAENCDNDGTFRRSLLYSDNPATGMDDITDFAAKFLITKPAITEFKVYTMPCTSSQGSGSPNALGIDCASLKFDYTSPTSGIQISSGETPKDGRLLYSWPYTPSEGGRLIIRATIPVRYISQWNHAIMGAVYLDDTLIQTGELIDPNDTAGWSYGGTGVLLATATNIQAGKNYNINIYLYSHPAPGGAPAHEAETAWAGAIKLVDHQVDGFVEIMESGL
ncbi:MAG: hypothetical protein LRY36_01450 [Alphaproteobacteria bacterium]|nr:hypothetical protein [Alphaproteobacteria bacterium]MCD8566583.1 hypothetical protein [Alphaproteobacteria bacterium]